MYESPIEMIVKDIQLKQEEGIFKAIQECKVSVDREELLKALQYDREQYKKGYADRDAEIIRCKDCKWRDESTCLIHGAIWKDKDFCSHGERKEDELN